MLNESFLDEGAYSTRRTQINDARGGAPRDDFRNLFTEEEDEF